MLNKAHKSTKRLTSGMYGHLSLWAHSLRTVLMAVFILLMTYMLVRSKENSVAMNGFEVYLGETLFSYANMGFNLIMTSVALMVMMSELPKRVSYQNYTIIRLSRRKWLTSLVVFCVSVVLVFIACMLAFSAIFSLSFVTPGHGWSDLERLAADTNYAHESQYVTQYNRVLSPIAACTLASCILFLFWLTMAFLILLFSLWGAPNLGLIVCVSLLLLNITILFESLPGIKLPSHFATLGAVASQVHEHQFEFIAKVIIGYLLLDSLLLFLMDIRVKHMDIRFMGKE